ncbi:MAG: MafI family immunity protein [Akkermansiaceae bacterium]|nr:MafI family immunity protein [Akkermansiaceae bacterium]
MSYDYKQLETDLRELLGAMSCFSPSEVEEVEQFLEAGEYGLAFETFCGIAKEENKPVSNVLRPKVRALAHQMEIDPIWWTEIAKEE